MRDSINILLIQSFRKDLSNVSNCDKFRFVLRFQHDLKYFSPNSPKV